MNALAPIGHNLPPDPLDDAIATDAEALELAEGLLTGDAVENEAQMKAVDAVTKRIKALKSTVEAAKEAEYRPFKDGCDEIVRKYKPTLDDLDKQTKGLIGMVDVFKRKLAAEKAEAEHLARVEADRLRREAEAAIRAADVSDIEAQREAAAKQRAYDEAQRQAVAAGKDTVKGLRTFTIREITDGTALARWLWINDREALMGFMADYIKRLPHITADMPGVIERTEKRAV